MDPNNDADLLTALGWLVAAYEGRKGTYVTPEKLQVYQASLADLPLDRLKRSIELWILDEKEFPTVAELRHDVIFHKLNPPSADQAWMAVQNRKPLHPLVAQTINLLGGVPWHSVPAYGPGTFKKSYEEVVKEEVRHYSEWSLEAHRGRLAEGGDDAGGPGGRRVGGDVVPALPGGRGDSVGRAQGDDRESKAYSISVDDLGRYTPRQLVQDAG
jgi:hypothetical protein